MAITKSSTYTAHGDGSVHFYSALISVTGNDTTTNIDSNTISNLDFGIKDLWAGVTVTDQTGSSPTVQIVFRGSFDGTVFFDLPTAQDQDDTGTYGTADSSALNIATASSTNVAAGISTSMFGLKTLPPHLKVRTVTGGTGTPGYTGEVSAVAFR